MKRIMMIATAIIAVSIPAFAQQQQSSQDQLVSLYATVNLNLSKQVDAANASIVAANAQISEMQKKIDDLQKQIADGQAKSTPEK